MAINAKNKPGCPCCQCECGNGELYPKFTRIKVTISGLPASYSISYGYDFSGDALYGTYTASGLKYWFGTFTIGGLDDLNGTHFFDVPNGEDNCLEQEGYETGLIDTKVFDFIDRSYSLDFYESDCDFSLNENDAWYAQVRIELYRFADERYRVKLVFEDEAAPDLLEESKRQSYELRACQNLGCGNDFDATKNLTFSQLPDDGSNINEYDCDNVPTYCKDGNILGFIGIGDLYVPLEDCAFNSKADDCFVDHGNILAEITN